VDNVGHGADDIDYFVVTAPGRLWTTRALIIALVRLARRRGVTLCPNYLVSERALVLADRNLFTAHELAQMVPLGGEPLYGHLRWLNRWVGQYLPNAGGPPRPVDGRRPRGRWLRTAAERMGQSAAGGLFERWERERKIRKLGSSAPGGSESESSFGPECCKGHFNRHGERVMSAHRARLAGLEAVSP
jgi:hypothetical protein